MVTGANTGLGQAIAVALAGAGADIVAVGRTDPAETKATVLAAGRRFIGVQADLADTRAISMVVGAALAEFPRIDILVNNAGIIRRSDALDFTEADWDAVMDVNLKSAFFLTQAIGRLMIEAGYGKVINIASMLSFQGGIRVASYTASKSGIAGLTRLLANEWAGKGVNVNHSGRTLGKAIGDRWGGRLSCRACLRLCSRGDTARRRWLVGSLRCVPAAGYW